MIGKRVNFIALTLLNVFIVSTVTSSPTPNSNLNTGYQFPTDRVNDGEVPVPVPLTIYEQTNADQPQEILRAEDEYINYLREIFRRRAAINALAIHAIEPIISQKRSCYLNAGMTHNCDFKELMSAVNARKFWESASNPGKRRKRSFVNPMKY